MNIHPKVAFSTLATLLWTAICLALTQYLPTYAPNAALTAAVGTFVAALAGYFGPSGSDGASVEAGSNSGAGYTKPPIVTFTPPPPPPPGPPVAPAAT